MSKTQREREAFSQNAMRKSKKKGGGFGREFRRDQEEEDEEGGTAYEGPDGGGTARSL